MYCIYRGAGTSDSFLMSHYLDITNRKEYFFYKFMINTMIRVKRFDRYTRGYRNKI